MNKYDSYLSCPPPLSSVHVMIDLDSPVLISIMAFGFSDEVVHKIRIAPQGL